MAASAYGYATTPVHSYSVLAVRMDVDDGTRLAPCLASLVLNPHTGSWLQATSSTALARALLAYFLVTLCHLSLPLF